MRILLFVLIVLCVTQFAQAQLVTPGIQFRVSVATGDGAIITSAINRTVDSSTNLFVNAIFDGTPDPIGTSLISPFSEVTVEETLTDLGGGNFQLIISALSDIELAPTFAANPSDRSIFLIGQNTASGPNLILADHSVTGASVSAFSGTTLVGFRDVLSVPAFNDPDDPDNREWQGFLGAALADVVGRPAQPINEFRLTIDGFSESLVTTVPEPNSAVLLALFGLGSMIFRRRS